MVHGTGMFHLFEQQWRPEGDVKGIVVIVHGYAEHSGRYNYVAEFLTRHGYAVYAFDLRGHGRSEGIRAFVRLFNEYLIDLKDFLIRVNEKEPGRPLFLLGHSMGGAIAVLYCLKEKPLIHGLILSGPLLKISDRISPLKRTLIAVIGTIFPKLPVVKKLNCSLLSHDREVVRRYDNDPLVYRGKLLAREGREINLAINYIQRHMEDISLPLLILHGTGDRIVDVEGSRQLYVRAGSGDKTIKLYKDFYHEILNEPQRDTVLSNIVAWLDAHR